MVTIERESSMLPLASVTRNVLVVMPLGKVAPLARPALWVTTAPGQLSLLLTLKVTLLLLHWPMSVFPTMLAGQLMVGFSVSLMVTVKLHAAVLPLASVTRNLLVVMPLGKVAPLARPALWVTTAPGQLSLLLT